MTARRSVAELRPALEKLVDSFEKIELAWQLSTADGPLTEAQLQERAQLDVRASRDAVEALVRANVFVRNSESLKLGPRAQTAEFAEIMRLYSEDRVGVITELMSISIDRIRSMAANVFADAFVLHKKKR